MIHTEGASLSPGSYVAIGLLVFAAIILALSVGSIVVGGPDSEGRVFGALGVVVTIVMVAGTIAAMWPLSGDFHHYYRVTGTVSEVSSRLIGNDSGVSQRFVVRLKESGEPFAIDDSRAAFLKTGDQVDLRCKREFEFNSRPGFACKWNGM